MAGILLAQKILPLFIIIMISAVLTKCDVLKADNSKGLASIQVYLITPCSFINAFQVSYSNEIKNGLLLSYLSAACILAIIMLISFSLKRVLQLEPEELVSSLYSNAGSMIIPLVTALFGENYVIYSSAYMALNAILLWSHGKSVLCIEKEDGLIRKIITNPNIITIILGSILFFAQIKLPNTLREAIAGIGQMVGVSAMIIIGIMIGSLDFMDIFRYKGLWKVLLLRLIFFPMSAILFFKIFPLTNYVTNGKSILTISLLATSAPVATNITAMARSYGRDANYSSVICIVSTLLSIITMPLILTIYQNI